MHKILFVCSGNIFRSMSAEYICKDFLAHNRDITYDVSSAGITARPQFALPTTIQTLASFGIDCSGHKQRKLSKEILADQDIVVAMGLNHKQAIKEIFAIDAVLFNEVAFGQKEPVKDIEEAIPGRAHDMYHTDRYAAHVVRYIHYAMPYFVEHLPLFIK